MAIADRDKLGSHFIITLKADHHLDRFAILIFFGGILLLSRILYFVCEDNVR
jgi:cyclophilin family peptidyl-prolyl cis-trans isomerase